MPSLRTLALPVTLALGLSLAGCATPDSKTAERVATGAAVGAAGGAVVGAITGGFLHKAVLGAAAGAAGAMVYDQIRKNEERD